MPFSSRLLDLVRAVKTGSIPTRVNVAGTLHGNMSISRVTCAALRNLPPPPALVGFLVDRFDNPVN